VVVGTLVTDLLPSLVLQTSEVCRGGRCSSPSEEIWNEGEKFRDHSKDNDEKFASEVKSLERFSLF